MFAILPGLLALTIAAPLVAPQDAVPTTEAVPAQEAATLDAKLDIFNKQLSAEVLRSRRERLPKVDTKGGERAMQPHIKMAQAHCALYRC